MRCWLVMLLLFPLCAGCATYRAEDLDTDPRTAGNLPNKAQWEDLVVGAYFPSSIEMVRLFGVDMHDADVLPVIVYMQNRSKNAAYSIKSEDIFFNLPKGDLLRRRSPDQIQERFSFSQWRSLPAYVFLVIIGGVFSSLDIAEANQDMLVDYHKKHFDDIDLQENNDRTTRRVLFFIPPKDMEFADMEYQRGTLSMKVSRFQVSGDAASAKPDEMLRIFFR